MMAKNRFKSKLETVGEWKNATDPFARERTVADAKVLRPSEAVTITVTAGQVLELDALRQQAEDK